MHCICIVQTLAGLLIDVCTLGRCMHLADALRYASLNDRLCIALRNLLIPVREFPEIPGNRGPQNSRREFPGISEILAGITGNFASFVFF